MNAVLLTSLGIVGIVVGVAGMFFTFGPAVFADCGPDCEARGERLVAIGAGVLMLGITVLGGWAVRAGIREGRRAA